MAPEVLLRLHNNMFEIYEAVSEICDRHGLKYFVVGGTLLGAVVHKGYIPWDDDFDIAMPRDDYDLFINKYSKELPKRFYLHHTSTDSNYWLSFAKVRIKHTVFLEEKRKNIRKHSGIYMDIFPFDYSSKKNTFLQRGKWRIITWINNHVYTRVTGIQHESRSGKMLNPILNRFSVKRLSIFRDFLMRSFDKGERNYYVDIAGGRRLDNSYFAIDTILPLEKLPFGQSEVVVPKDPNSYLLQLYTEKYKIIPPKEKQITHMPVVIRFEDGVEYRP